MHLFAVRPIESVTVADIAEEAGMTPAAVYYHYASKDDLLLDGLRGFTTDLLDQLRVELRRPATEEGIGVALVALLGWTDEQRYAATTYFVTSPGLSISVEALRQHTRLEMVDQLTAAVRRRVAGVKVAEASASATGLLALLEQSAASWLTEDSVFANFGRRRFSAEVVHLARLISGS
jgi:AcrR family transcriptional regulator